MSNKLGVIFVALLAISFVHSLPRLSDVTGGDPNADQAVAILIGLMEGLNASSIKAIFFEVGDSHEGASASELVFGPQIDPVVFLTKLNDDIVQSYKRRCKKISGSDDTYFRVKDATKELFECLEKYAEGVGYQPEFDRAPTSNDLRVVFNGICNDRHVPIRCVDTFLAVDAQCSFPSEIETDQSIYRIVTNILDLICRNAGNDLFTLIYEQGPPCSQESQNELLTCANKASYAIVKRLLVKLIENETFEFKMDIDDCREFDQVKNCFVSSLENCVYPAPKEYVSSLFQIIRNETSCARDPSHRTNLLN